ncbi:MAG: amidoligase family protein [Myxococcota bacterium]
MQQSRQPLPRAGRVGVEIEVGGVTVDEAASVCAEVLGGTVDHVSTYAREVETRHGTFRLELDSSMLQSWGERLDEASLGARMLEAVATEAVPTEIVSPPLDRGDLERLDDLCRALRAAGARGTGDGLRWALGVHFNPELDPVVPEDITHHLQAFCVLYDHLKKRGDTDISRELSPFIEPYPEAYVALVLSDAYAPSLDRLVADYLHHNPTRNRALDMLPMMKHLRPQPVEATLPDEKIKARPTFHYRLANCAIERDDWSIVNEWVAWVAIETLAHDPERLHAARRGHLRKDTDRPWLAQVLF